MTASLYDYCVPALKLGLTNLSALLDKAAAHAEARKVDTTVVADARLIFDMFPLKRQVQIACDAAKGGGARLAGVDAPSHPDTETTFDELLNRIDATIAFLDTLKPDQMVGAETRSVTLKMQGSEIVLTGQVFLLNLAMPNFYFHISTAYDILRHNGVVLGKRDFLGAP